MVGTTAFASYGNYDFSFRIQGSVDNAQDATPHYRDTTDNSLAWRVKLESSEEGEGTITTFWLEIEDGTNASSTHNVKQGNGFYYFSANNYADNAWVYLTGENNNFATSTEYNVSGKWNPLTDIHV